MSKSYNNIIPVFASPDEIRKIIARVNGSQRSRTQKIQTTCIIYNIYKLLAPADQVKAFRKRFTDGGLSWKEAKDTLADMIIDHFAPARARYNDLMNDKANINKIRKKNEKRPLQWRAQHWQGFARQ